MIDLFILAAMQDGRWRPGIGDPTFLGWLTVVAYFAAALVSGRVWRADLRAQRNGDRTASPTYWMVLTALLAFLGVNKQLDLQSLLTDVARQAAKSQSWYGQRRQVQIAFIAGVGIFACFALAAFAWIARRNLRRNVYSLTGIVLLMAFVVVRAASFHHVDAFIGSRLAGVKWNAILELGGIGLTTAGALAAMRIDRARRATSAPIRDPGRDDGVGARRYRIPGAGRD